MLKETTLDIKALKLTLMLTQTGDLHTKLGTTQQQQLLELYNLNQNQLDFSELKTVNLPDVGATWEEETICAVERYTDLLYQLADEKQRLVYYRLEILIEVLTILLGYHELYNGITQFNPMCRCIGNYNYGVIPTNPKAQLIWIMMVRYAIAASIQNLKKDEKNYDLVREFINEFNTKYRFEVPSVVYHIHVCELQDEIAIIYGKNFLDGDYPNFDIGFGKQVAQALELNPKILNAEECESVVELLKRFKRIKKYN